MCTSDVTWGKDIKAAALTLTKGEQWCWREQVVEKGALLEFGVSCAPVLRRVLGILVGLSPSTTAPSSSSWPHIYGSPTLTRRGICLTTYSNPGSSATRGMNLFMSTTMY